MPIDPRTLQWIFGNQMPTLGPNVPGSLAALLAPGETQAAPGAPGAPVTAPTAPLSPLARAQEIGSRLNQNAYGSASPMLPDNFPRFNDPRIVQGLLGSMAMNGDQGAADELRRQIGGGGGGVSFGGYGGGYGGGMSGDTAETAAAAAEHEESANAAGSGGSNLYG